MDYYLTRNQETFGPYSEKELRDHLKSGAVLPDDYAWHEGQAEWIPFCIASFPQSTKRNGRRHRFRNQLLPQVGH